MLTCKDAGVTCKLDCKCDQTKLLSLATQRPRAKTCTCAHFCGDIDPAGNASLLKNMLSNQWQLPNRSCNRSTHDSLRLVSLSAVWSSFDQKVRAREMQQLQTHLTHKRGAVSRKEIWKEGSFAAQCMLTRNHCFCRVEQDLG